MAPDKLQLSTKIVFGCEPTHVERHVLNEYASDTEGDFLPDIGMREMAAVELVV